uniref:DNA repair protein n=1 Tax=Treponema denticola TaxID=158 RepID=M1EWK0_TREDN|nr:DNA repair protein [Treponema denticola]
MIDYKNSSNTDKPDMRERLLEYGPQNLSDSDLVAVLLRTGIKDKPVKELADDIILHIDRARPEKIEGYLRSIRGMGDSKISTVLAAMELGRRYYDNKNRTISHPTDVVPLLQHYADRDREHFICVSLNGANEIIATRVVSVGTINRTIVHPREVYSDPLKDRAAAIIAAHNHPSGNLEPSSEDMELTRRLYEAGKILGVKLLDHIILVPNGNFFSFVQSGTRFDI